MFFLFWCDCLSGFSVGAVYALIPNSLMSSSIGRALPSSTSWSARLSSLTVVLSYETSIVSNSSSIRFAALAKSFFSSMVSMVVIMYCTPCMEYWMGGFLNFCRSKLV